MYIVVSNARKKPKELDGFQVEIWTAQQFIEKASAEDGLDVDEGFWYHTNILTQDIYDALADYKDGGGVNIVYFRYNTDPPSEVYIDGGEVVCEDPDAPVVEPEPTPAPISEPAPEIKPEPSPAVDMYSPAPTQEPTLNPELTVETRPGSIPYNPPVAPEPANNSIYSQPAAPQQIEPQPAPIPQPTYQPPVMPTAPVAQPTVPQIPVEPAPIPTPAPAPEPASPKIHLGEIGGLKIADDSGMGHAENILRPNAANLLEKEESIISGNSNGPAKVILFGSAKGGTGKTFTAAMSAYWFAKTHPELRVALADFDIIDGQIAITTNQVRPTVQGFYKDYKAGNTTFNDLYKYHANSDNFSSNIDFYLAPAQDIPEIVKDNDFWRTIFVLLVKNYDVVFFDSGIDYMGTKPISDLYKIADKIIITCNTSINSVNSIIKECLTLSGKRPNNVFTKEECILDRTHLVLTRVSDEYKDVNDQVVASLTKYAPIIAAFGNIDGLIYRVQWGGTWYLIDEEPNITANLERITDLSEDE